MLLSAIFAGVFAYTSQRINRWEGVVLLGMFVLYMVLAL
jgi:Ca2+/Na+ antiporter